MPALLFYILTPLFLPSSFVYLSYFIPAVPKRERLGKHLCMSYPFPIAILNGTYFFLSLVQEKLNMSSGHYLLAWILGVVSKQLSLLQGRVRDYTTLVNSLSSKMRSLVEDAVASCCWAFWAHQE